MIVGRGDGVALPVVLLLMLALTGLGHGVLLLCRGELASSTTAGEVLQARLAAESAVRVAADVLLAPSAEVLPPWHLTELEERSLAPTVRYSATARRLGDELVLLVGRGWVVGRGGERRTGRVIWRMDPRARVDAWTGVAEIGGILEVDPTSSVVGSPGEPLRNPSALPPLGLLPGGRLLDLGRPVEPGGHMPAAVISGGICVTSAPDNWGSPSDSTGPCGAHFPFLGVNGSVSLHGGEGQGLLVVAGDLDLTAGTRFAGVALVGGDLTLSGGASFRGLARVFGDLLVQNGSMLTESANAALQALQASGLDSLWVPVPGGSWISPF
jgi:hypothetical protein